MSTLTFDVRFRDAANLGQAVDADLRVELFEEGEDTPALTRYIGADANTSILATTDSEGVQYTTVVDGSTLGRGAVTAKWYAKSAGNLVQPSPYIESQANTFASGELNITDVKDYIKASLGFPAVAVELTGAQYGHVIEETLQLYGQHVPKERVHALGFVPQQQKYLLPDIGVDGPFDVKFVRKVVTPIASDPVFGREYLRSNQPDMGTLIMGEAYLDMSLRILSSEPDWKWLSDEKALFINIGPGISPNVYGGYDVSLRYYETATLPQVPVDHHRWFKKNCLALAKGILAQIRGKFSGMVPTPGQTMQLNGAQMAQESTQEQEALKQELSQMQWHAPPMFG